jgi:hypothetical protein
MAQQDCKFNSYFVIELALALALAASVASSQTLATVTVASAAGPGRPGQVGPLAAAGRAEAMIMDFLKSLKQIYWAMVMQMRGLRAEASS